MKTIKHFIKNNKINLLLYIGGFIILGLSVNIIKASGLGSGAWDTVTINGRDFLNNNIGITWVTLGMIAFTLYFILMVIVLIYRKKAKYLLMIIPIIMVSVFLDVWNILVFQDRQAIQLVYQIILYIAGALLLPFGLTMIVKSSFPAFVFDEFMLMMVDVFKAKKITFVRLGIEFTGILVGAVLGYLTYYHIDGSLGVVNIGSFILAFSLAPVMTYYYKIFKVKRTN